MPSLDPMYPQIHTCKDTQKHITKVMTIGISLSHQGNENHQEYHLLVDDRLIISKSSDFINTLTDKNNFLPKFVNNSVINQI